MRLFTLAMLALLISPLLAAPIPKAIKGKANDQDLLQGLWQEVRTSHNGEPLRNTKPDDYMRIEENTISTWAGANKGFEKQPFTIDSTTAPKRLSVKQKDGSDYNFCFEFDENGVLRWAEMATEKTKYPEKVQPAKDVYYSESVKTQK